MEKQHRLVTYFCITCQNAHELTAKNVVLIDGVRTPFLMSGTE